MNWQFINVKQAEQLIQEHKLVFDYVRFAEPPVATWSNGNPQNIVLRKCDPSSLSSEYEVLSIFLDKNRSK